MNTHILLVEPDALSAMEFRDALSFIETQITIAHSDVDALTLLEAGVRPDVALIVWGGGELRGPNLVRGLRKRLPHLPILLVFEEDAQIPQEVDSLSVQGLLTKPLLFAGIPAALREAIEQAPRPAPAARRAGPGATAELDVGAMLGEPGPTSELDVEGMLGEPGPTSELDVEAMLGGAGFTAEADTPHSLSAVLDEPLGGQPSWGHVELTQQQTRRLVDKLKGIGAVLEQVPLLLSQDGALVAHVGGLSHDTASAMARLAGRVWREGATRPAREWLCFNDQTPSEGGQRRSVALYSVAVAGDLSLSLAWDGSSSFSTLRADALQAAAALRSLLR